MTFNFTHLICIHRTSLPPVCPQPLQDGSGDWTGVEDCLYIALYAPDNLNGTALVFFHGGSLLVGGANDAAIEASKLALATQSVVAVVQYRLGVLGWLPPASSSSATNLGLRDAIVALRLLKTVLPAFGVSNIAIGGHSAGGLIIRALLATPSAASLYNKAIMLSDPMNYAMYNASTLTTLQNNFFPNLGCSTTDAACHNALSLGSILTAQIGFTPADYDGSTAGPIPYRPIKDGSLVTSSLTTTFPSTLKPVLVTTAHDEGGALIYGQVPALPAEYFPAVLPGVLPDFRADAVLNSSYYTLDTSDDDTLRWTLKNVVTDLGWKCADWTFAKAWAARSGKVWTAEILRGGIYSSNADIEFCSDSELHVCHQNDLPIVFGTAPSPTLTQSSLTTELQARIKMFIRDTNPNAPGYATWSKTTASNVNRLSLTATSGATASASGPCADFWGTPTAPFDWQIWGL
ncbi:alpha/beta-hydrolase [Auriculariales sp. MPI-PUGE-AT-0066]|nr:alpha/beta-hydrolase [Auriculariales sp. MPI-PUGE-AT-0066]